MKSLDVGQHPVQLSGAIVGMMTKADAMPSAQNKKTIPS
jgi:hypothetical protein